MRFTLVLAAAALSVVGIVVASDGAGATSAAHRSGDVLAYYDGRVIDLAVSWEGAAACNSDGITTTCFDTIAQADAARRAVGRSAADGGFGALATCASTSSFYDGTSYSGSALFLSTRLTWINLSGYGFAARVSSYKIGACTTYQRDGDNGTGTLYPGATAPGSNVPTMAAGWDNRIRSVYLA